MEFQVCSWFAKDIEIPSADKDSQECYHTKYAIVMFGRDMQGRSVACTVHNFLPHFYVKIKKAGWTAGDLSKLTEELEFKMGYRFKGCIADARIVRKKEFWGFTDNAEFSFARICFKTEIGMRVAAKAFASGNVAHPKQRAFKLYESNILPFLRFAHMQNVSPAGWVKVAKPIDALDVDLDVGPKTEVSLHVSWKHIHGIPNKAAISPLRILAVDIECMSSDGDFPVPRKTYIKVASDIYGAVKQNQDPKQLKSQQKQEMAKRAIVNMLAEKFEDGALRTLYADRKPTRAGLDRLVRENYEHMELIIGGDKTIMQQALKDRFMANPVLQNKYSAFLQTFQRVAAKSTSATSTRLQMDAWFKALAAKVHMKDADAIEKDAPGILNIAFGNKDGIVDVLTHYLSEVMPLLRGDEIIQIGMTVHRYGDSECCDRVMLSLGSCSAIPGCKVVECKNERELLRAWVKETEALDPDVVCGYNVLGFDFHFIYERCEELGIADDMQRLSRLRFQPAEYRESKLSSSALGDNLLKYFDMPGRTCIDVMKVVQRDHKLDSYKLDSVATHFMGMCKGDVSPAEIFKLYLGTADDRARIAKYCIQDCELCNHLVMKLEIIANNMGMANVCCVPMHFIFMRGQGVKIFSLVAQQCKTLGYLIPTKVVDEGVEGDGLEGGGGEESAVGYEGAIVLPPKSGIYIEHPVAVLDYASLYPSSMISENLSHDRIVLDEKYDNLEGVEYTDVTYDIYEGKGDEKRKVGEKVCRYAQGDMGVIPHILQHLLKQRKETRKRMTLKSVRDSSGGTCVTGYWNEAKREVTLEDGSIVQVSSDVEVTVEDHFDVFQKAVLDGLQNAYKVTANSLYGQVGSRTSPIYLKDIAACTTATGRKMILLAKKFLEDEYDAKTVYGDTDSLFVYFPDAMKEEAGKARVEATIEIAAEASRAIKPLLKKPHDLEYEKTFWPFILFSKKRYVANTYGSHTRGFKQSSMGIVLKRRDNANIVKRVYGGIIDIILNRHDVASSTAFLTESLQKLIKGEFPLEDLVVSKSLRAHYKDPTRIAHKVLADRIKERSPGSAPQVNDRIPYVYVIPEKNTSKKPGGTMLQGDRIEHPDYIKERGLVPDYEVYISNQIMNPVVQIYALDGVLETLAGYDGPSAAEWGKIKAELEREKSEKYAAEKCRDMREARARKLLFDPILKKLSNDPMLIKLKNKQNGNQTITDFFVR
jgi:DNA polymerase delta subunit 1